jgi:hypothetical protein
MDLATLLAPVSTFVVGLDLASREAAEAALVRRFPPGGEELVRIEAAARAALAAGRIANRGEPHMRFSRVVKPKDDVAGCAIDCVYMDDCEGPAHTHPNGEVVLCFPDQAAATFDGVRGTWVVLPKGSRHTPTVRGGSMLILYWLPDGAVEWV